MRFVWDVFYPFVAAFIHVIVLPFMFDGNVGRRLVVVHVSLMEVFPEDRGCSEGNTHMNPHLRSAKKFLRASLDGKKLSS